ncbi:monooxygenase [Streptomyces tendae]|uniref:flavin reductase family protein n=1 Tax=Streptomyces tendae TaxID=1932 RepID=UPI001678CDB9|nr:flavin reductase family protein [Streptomyces tendae]GHB13227.1 monooxygenase [Streptomyces tendae]
MTDPPAPGPVREAAHRAVLGHFASGVAVVTADGPDSPVGLTCQSFVSLSLEPPLISFAPARTSRTWPLVRASGAFCVNVLAEEQQRLADAFARSGGDKFRGVAWSPGPDGAPLLEGACAWISCALVHEYDGGDHTIAVGRVTALRAEPSRDPLIFHRGRYRALAVPSPLAG